ncbi:MAG: 50S ribosomal protein L9 [uncultured bacterium]|nr:MAG: 50S ribosomal protein L9 [uncultured bacterium]
MKIILSKTVKNLGGKNDIVKVKNGYAKNFLLPKKMAIPATKGAIKNLKFLKQKKKKKKKDLLKNAEAIIAGIEKEKFEIKAKAGEKNKLFGSVTNSDIAELLSRKTGFSIGKEAVKLEKEIKILGKYKVKVNITPKVSTKINLEIKKDDKEKKKAGGEKDKKKQKKK